MRYSTHPARRNRYGCRCATPDLAGPTARRADRAGADASRRSGTGDPRDRRRSGVGQVDAGRTTARRAGPAPAGRGGRRGDGCVPYRAPGARPATA